MEKYYNFISPAINILAMEDPFKALISFQTIKIFVDEIRYVQVRNHQRPIIALIYVKLYTV